MFVNESAPVEWMDKLLVYTVIGTVVGARLGHVFFYDWDYYKENLIEILMVWKGGLASCSKNPAKLLVIMEEPHVL